MSLAKLIEDHKAIVNPKFRHLDFAEGAYVTVIFEQEGFYWARTQKGDHITLSPEYAGKGWSLYLEKRKERYLAYYSRKLGTVEWKAEKVLIDADTYRVEQLDFEIETTG